MRESPKTLETRETWLVALAFQLVAQGETSGNTQRVIEVLLDCDGDALLCLVVQWSSVHTGAERVFTTNP